ncbi:MAG: alpha/beta fold hydrolase [Dehalococcoidia bacterium]
MTTSPSETLVDLDGVHLWTSQQGAGGHAPGLVMLHGGPGLWEDFGALAAMVEDLVEVYRYDQRGCGRSDRVGPYDLATAVADLEALRKQWWQPKLILAGHSFGAALALAYAVEHPEHVAALILISGTGVDLEWKDEAKAEAAARRSPDDRNRLAELHIQRAAGVWNEDVDRELCALTWATDFADRTHDVDRAAALYRAPGPNYEMNRAMTADWARMLLDGFAERVGEVTAPVLLMNGVGDPRPLSATARLALRLPNAELAILDDCGHFPWLEQPELTRVTLREFLRDLLEKPEDGA